MLLPSLLFDWVLTELSPIYPPGQEKDPHVANDIRAFWALKVFRSGLKLADEGLLWRFADTILDTCQTLLDSTVTNMILVAPMLAVILKVCLSICVGILGSVAFHLSCLQCIGSLVA